MSSQQITAVQSTPATSATEQIKSPVDQELGSKFLQLFQEIIGGTAQVAWEEIAALANVAPLVEAPEQELKAPELEPKQVQEEEASEDSPQKDAEEGQSEADVSAEATAVAAATVAPKAQGNPLEMLPSDDESRADLPAFVLDDEAEGQANMKAEVKTTTDNLLAGTAPEVAGDQSTAEELNPLAQGKDARMLFRPGAGDADARMRALKAASAGMTGEELDASGSEGVSLKSAPGAAGGNAGVLAQGLGKNVAAVVGAEQLALARGTNGPAGSESGSSTGNQRTANGNFFELPGMNAAQAVEKNAASKARGATQTAAGKDQEKLVEQVKEMLRRAAMNRDGNSISVRLNPPELGGLIVKVTERHGQIFARVSPESKEVETMLRTKVQDVTQALVQLGFRSDQLHISIGRERADSEMFGLKDFQQQLPQQGTPQERSGGDSAGQRSELPLASPAFEKQDAAEAGWVA